MKEGLGRGFLYWKRWESFEEQKYILTYVRGRFLFVYLFYCLHNDEKGLRRVFIGRLYLLTCRFVGRL